MRLLLFGGWGQLGSDLMILASETHEVARPRHADADVTDAASVRRLLQDRTPDVVINAAAFHKVELCEQDPERAFAVNALGALNVARATRTVGARSVFISTDYVFDGSDRSGYSEDAPRNPLNIYGVSKLAGESAVREADADALVVRGSGLFGHAGSAGKGGNFVDNMIRRARAGEPLSVVDDQVFAPTATRDMAQRILHLLERHAPGGTYHAANAGSCSWYELARAALELDGVNADLSPSVTAEGPVRRPHCSTLLDTRGPELGLPPMRPWRDALRWYLSSRPAPDTEVAR
jgi:dTDP-4-dehydrorhamnose reductase